MRAILYGLSGVMDTLGDILKLFTTRRRLWILPLVLILLLLASILWLGSATPLGPLIYPVF
ncbi:MAG: hypothetical protein JNL98_27085 [Bryobacterales bacterium]|nr:hypothetical protein [Bryobacterales bacterium]